ncbi:MAG: tetratricopeptide repeat protein [Verrucomicrobiota bacterium]
MKLHQHFILLLAFGIATAQAAESKSPLSPEIIVAAERGEAEAQFQLARACLRGEGVPKDVNKAYHLMKAAADQGHADAMGGLGYFYSVGVVVAKDEKLAAEWFRKGATKGSAKAQLNLGKLLLAEKAGGDGADPEKLHAEAVQWIKQAADQGLPEAGLAYGNILYFGDHGVARDYAKAAPYLTIAAEHGLAEALNYLGVMNEYGLGMPKNVAAAEPLYRQAALKGNAKAQSNLGAILNPRNENHETRIEALAWLMIATSLREVTADKLLRDATPGLEKGDLEAATKRVPELQKLIEVH